MYLIFVFVSSNAGSFYLLPINSISNDGYFGSQTDGFFSLIAKESLLLHAWVAAENCWCPGQWWIPWSCALSAREVPKCEEHRPSTRSEPSDSQWKQVIWALVVDRNPKFCLLVHIIAWSSTWTKVLPLRMLRALYTLDFPTKWQAEIQFLMRMLKSQVKWDWAKSKSQIWPLFSEAALLAQQ